MFSNRRYGNNHYWAYQTNNDGVEYDGILMSLTLLNKKKAIGLSEGGHIVYKIFLLHQIPVRLPERYKSGHCWLRGKVS